MLGNRGRLTVGQIVQLVFVLGFLGALVPVFYTSLDANAGDIGTGPGLLFRALIPLMIVVLLNFMWTAATEGAS